MQHRQVLFRPLPSRQSQDPIAGLAVALLLRIAGDHSDVAVVACVLCSVWCSFQAYPDQLEIPYPDKGLAVSGGAHGA